MRTRKREESVKNQVFTSEHLIHYLVQLKVTFSLKCSEENVSLVSRIFADVVLDDVARAVDKEGMVPAVWGIWLIGRCHSILLC